MFIGFENKKVNGDLSKSGVSGLVKARLLYIKKFLASEEMGVLALLENTEMRGEKGD